MYPYEKNPWPGRLIWIAILAILIYFALNISSYFDPLSFCRIKIQSDIVRGEGSTIKSAVKYIKAESPSGYDVLCRYVDVIAEKRCVVGDKRIDPSVPDFPDGCYVRGTKTIYLLATKDKSSATIQKRASLILKFAGMSRAFWGER